MKLLITVLLVTLSSSAFAQEGWNDVTPAGTYPGFHGVYALDTDNVWVVGDEGTILNSTNGGTTWSEINCPVTYPLYNVHFINSDTGWVGGDNDVITEIMRTTDRGLSWELKTLSSASDYGNYDIEFIEGGSGEPPSGFVSAGLSLVWKTDDYGENWADIGFGGCGANDLQSICFINKDEGWFVGTPSVTQEVSIVHTTNGGQTYETQINPTDPDIKLNCVRFATNQQGIAVGLAGTILYTSDGGQNWELRQSIGNRWQSVFLTESGKAWAVGNSGNVAYSTDWGYTWEFQQSGVTSELWEVYFIDDNEGWIVGGGVGLPGVILHTTNGGVITDVEEEINTVREFVLHQNYPNPFNPSTNIRYQISERSFITLKVYDVLGNEVATLVNEEKSVGEYEVEFNGNGLTSGVYFYQLKTVKFIETKKMILLR
ncbi:MAG: YCF48-related protein [Ignavibacteria bacterium]|nr:YCF48-related protein [Ignavibacteria bacterium]